MNVVRSASRWHAVFLTASCIILWPALTPAQVLLNEIMANNRSAVPYSGMFPDYIELHNAGGSDVNLAGMSLTDDPVLPRKFVFPAGTSLAAGSRLIVWCGSGLTGSGLHASFGLGSEGELVRLYAANGVTILDQVVLGLQAEDLSTGRVPDGTATWTLTEPSPMDSNSAQPLGPPVGLYINEWMARPASGEDWLEVYNSSASPINMSGMVLSDSTASPAANRPIPALSFLGPGGFVQFFASDLEETTADHLDFRLGAGGETLTLYAPGGTMILNRVTFGEQPDNIAQGRAPDGSDNIIFFPAGRASPGMANFESLQTVVVSEVLTHSDPPLEDAIELQNLTASPVDIGRWWLSDSESQPKKYQIPAGTVLPAYGFKVFYAVQFGAGPNGFQLNSFEGDQVFLSVADATGELTGAQHAVAFGAIRNGVSMGRVKTSVGVDFVPLSARTFGVDNPLTLTQFRQGTGLSNATPRIGPVVLSEIHYHPLQAGPAGSGEEFLEFHNPGASAVSLFHPFYTTNTWRIRQGITFDFPRNISIPAKGYLLLVDFDPELEPVRLANFRAHHGIPESVRVLGPYGGQLSDSTDILAVQVPDEPEGPGDPNAGFVPYELNERVEYSSGAPWPGGASGIGFSIHRADPAQYGNEPLNWFSGPATPGRANAANDDTDGDGMPDAWELQYGLNPESNLDATTDLDGDGASNLDEYRAGTDPSDPEDRLQIDAIRFEPPVLRLMFEAVEGKVYALQSREHVGAGDWQTVTNLPPAQASGPQEVQIDPGSDGHSFFRLMLPETP